MLNIVGRAFQCKLAACRFSAYTFYMQNEDIQFDLEEEPRVAPHVETPLLVRFVIDHSFGFISDEKEANFFMIMFSAVAFLLAIFFLVAY